MFEVSEGMITVLIKTFPGFEYEYVEDIQKDLLQCLDMAQLIRKYSELDDYPKGNLTALIQLMEAFQFSADQVKKSHPMIDNEIDNDNEDE